MLFKTENIIYILENLACIGRLVGQSYFPCFIRSELRCEYVSVCLCHLELLSKDVRLTKMRNSRMVITRIFFFLLFKVIPLISVMHLKLLYRVIELILVNIVLSWDIKGCEHP